LRRRSKIRNALEYLIAVFILHSLRFTPRLLAEKLARLYIRLIDLAIPRLRRTALRNLELALPELSAGRREEIVEGVFRCLARRLLTFACLPCISRRNISKWIRLEGFENFEKALAKGRGVLIATAHLGDWELSAYAHALLNGPMYVVVRPLDNPWLDRLVERRRMLAGNRIIDKKQFARGILKALAANQAVGILIDQNTSADQGVFVDFFGLPACSHTGLPRLAAHSGAPVIAGFALWDEQEGRYVLRFYPEIPMSGDIQADAARLQSLLEDIIRRHPDQWLWIHRRWKTRPPGQPPLYP